MAFLQGFNCSCFAYGHTGSGKTYSMFGCSDDNSLPDDAEALAAPPQGEGFGLVPRVCYSLLHRLQEANEGKHGRVQHCQPWERDCAAWQGGRLLLCLL